MALVNPQAVTVYDKAYSSADIRRHPDSNFVRLIEWIFRPAGQNETRVVVDWGFGGGAHLVHLLERGFRVIGVEISEKACEHATALLSSRPDFRGKWQIVRLDEIANHAPLPANSVDFVLASESLYFQASHDALTQNLAACRNILKPGGTLIASMIGPAHNCCRESRKIADDLYEYQPAGADSPLPLFVIADAEHAKNIFAGFDVTEVGSYGFEFCGRNHFHWVIICSKPLSPHQEG